MHKKNKVVIKAINNKQDYQDLVNQGTAQVFIASKWGKSYDKYFNTLGCWYCYSDQFGYENSGTLNEPDHNLLLIRSLTAGFELLASTKNVIFVSNNPKIKNFLKNPRYNKRNQIEYNYYHNIVKHFKHIYIYIVQGRSYPAGLRKARTKVNQLFNQHYHPQIKVKKSKSAQSSVVKTVNVGYKHHYALDQEPASGIRVFIDGGKRLKGNVGAYAYSIQGLTNKMQPEFKQAVKYTTNQRMELKALHKFLTDAHPLQNKPIAIMTDSQYLMNVFTNEAWLETWVKQDWKTSTGKKVKNADLILGIVKKLKKYKKVFFYKVKGHDNNAGNNRVDLLVNQAMDEYLKENY